MRNGRRAGGTRQRNAMRGGWRKVDARLLTIASTKIALRTDAVVTGGILAEVVAELAGATTTTGDALAIETTEVASPQLGETGSSIRGTDMLTIHDTSGSKATRGT